MISSKFDHLWRLMSDYTMEIDGEVPQGVMCALCCKLLIDPYAAECGCQFCGECIKDYLKEDFKNCPISKDGCKEVMLKIDGNVFRDVRAYNNIKNVSVKCPNDGCIFSGLLETIGSHIIDCKSKQESCPFHNFGCGDVSSEEESVEVHLRTNAYTHARILFQMNIDLRKEVDNLNEKLTLKDIEIHDLKENNDGQYKKDIDDLIENFRQEIGSKMDDIKIQMKENSVLEITNIQDRLGTLNDQINELNLCKEKIWNEIETMKKREVKQIENVEDKEEENHSTELQVVLNNDTKKVFVTNGDVVESTISKNEEPDRPNFTWIIDHFSKKIIKENIGKLFLSEPFYHDNYKLCLCGKVTNLPGLRDNLYLEVYSMIMMGEHDDIVKWPMMLTVELSIMNQGCGRAHKVGRYSYDTRQGQVGAFQRPGKYSRDYIGGLSVSVNTLLSVSGIWMNDSVMVTCCLDV